MAFPKEQNQAGEFKRQDDLFRKWISRDGSSGYPAEKGRYHLYVSFACPWAHRTIIVRKLKELEGIVGMTVVDPVRDELGWAFRDGDGFSRDPVNGFKYLSEAYWLTDPEFHQRVTVPVLWDKKERKILNNSEEDIVRMFNSAFIDLTSNRLDLYPEPLRQEIDLLNEFIYSNINDGVYRAGFATSQAAYENAAYKLFEALEVIEERLARNRYLLGNDLTETDWRLFPTLIRFDAVYHGHFKCNIRRIADYKNLIGYLKELYQQKGIAETVRLDHIKRHYYMTHPDINPTRIVPVGPLLDLTSAHGRGSH
ncbi:MAG: glutathione S-transferase family protein [Nitrospirae bacterium]|nr:glutathione S-transferase family protein [Nitrospirota bacterium]MBI3594966.1 glutathione S-transferase family protein [Nitrospirota bacterium]